MSTKDAIVSLLRRKSMTASELAVDLDITRNAVIVPLRQLEAEGHVEGQERKAKRVGKPATEYRVVAGQEDRTSKAYPAFVEALLESLPDHLPPKQVEKLMKQVGRKLASGIDIDPKSSTKDRVKVARAFLDALGADTILELEKSETLIRSYSCPLGRAIRKEPCACKVVETFLQRVTGVKVKEQCKREGRLRCEFLIET